MALPEYVPFSHLGQFGVMSDQCQEAGGEGSRSMGPEQSAYPSPQMHMLAPASSMSPQPHSLSRSRTASPTEQYSLYNSYIPVTHQRSPVFMAATAISADQQLSLAESSYAGLSRSSESPPPIHKRGYQACDGCRKRKVKCEMGDVDRPVGPPCNRCRREMKQCLFSETRRKRRNEQNSGDDSTPPAMKRRMTSFEDEHGRSGSTSTTPQTKNPAWDWSHGQIPQLSNAANSMGQFKSVNNVLYGSERGDTKEHIILNQTVAGMLHPSLANNSDALHLLASTATQSEQTNQRKSPASMLNSPESQQRAGSSSKINFDPKLQSPAYQAAFNHWSRMKFVRAGYITSYEAMAYIEYYFQHLAPLSPIFLDEYRNPESHPRLLTEEPILAVALLAIASRYKPLTGPGSASRNFFVHDRIYLYLQTQIQRLVWSQEQFGGGFTGGGKVKLHEPKAGQLHWRGTYRTLGTIQALIILSDWHPRGLHFPPNEDDNRLLDMDYNEPENEESSSTQQSNHSAFLEPAWRCDRVSWTMLCLAQSLAFELGLFDKIEKVSLDQSGVSQHTIQRRRVRLLLSTYVSAHSGRMGIPTNLHPDQWEEENITDDMATARSRAKYNPVDAMQASWAGLVKIIHRANDEVFLWSEKRQELRVTGKFTGIISQIEPALLTWREEFLASNIEEPMRTILLLEEYSVHVYLNGLALESILEKWTKLASDNGWMQETRVSTTGAPVEHLQKLYHQNEKYIKATANYARHILRLCVDKLIPDGHLRHAPARTLFRITNGVLFALKCFVFGASEPEVREALELIDKCVEGMRTQVVDDVHIISDIAKYVGVVAANIRSSFIRIAAPGPGSGTSTRDRTPLRTTETHGNTNPPEQRPDQSYQSNTSAPFGYSFDQTADPLAGIPFQSLDEALHLGVTYMPPPNFNLFMTPMDNTDQGQGVNGGMINDGTIQDNWMTLPLDPVMNSSNAFVTNGYGGNGPVIDDEDLLEKLTHSQFNHQFSAPQMQYGNNVY